MEIELLVGQRQKKETDNAVASCNDYLRMGIGRSLTKLLDRYQTVTNSLPPTKRITTLKDWSRNFNWQDRASEYDATWETRKNAERQAVMDYGLALDYERVLKLKQLSDFLESQLYELSAPDEETGIQTYLNVWMPDVKSIGSGEFAQKVDIERFNSALIEQYRKVLEDIAKEVGGRVAKTDVTSGGEKLSIILKTGMSLDDL